MSNLTINMNNLIEILVEIQDKYDKEELTKKLIQETTKAVTKVTKSAKVTTPGDPSAVKSGSKGRTVTDYLNMIDPENEHGLYGTEITNHSEIPNIEIVGDFFPCCYKQVKGGNKGNYCHAVVYRNSEAFKFLEENGTPMVYINDVLCKTHHPILKGTKYKISEIKDTEKNSAKQPVSPSDRLKKPAPVITSPEDTALLSSSQSRIGSSRERLLAKKNSSLKKSSIDNLFYRKVDNEDNEYFFRLNSDSKAVFTKEGDEFFCIGKSVSDVSQDEDLPDNFKEYIEPNDNDDDKAFCAENKISIL